MKYIVHIYSKLDDSGQLNNSNILTWTPMDINCNVGDDITLSFPDSVLRNNKWLSKIPLNPYKVEQIDSPEKNNYSGLWQGFGDIWVYYVGKETDLNKIKWS